MNITYFLAYLKTFDYMENVRKKYGILQGDFGLGKYVLKTMSFTVFD